MQKHLLIAGTGRSGTSFLVKYLTELGLDTHLSRHGTDAFWDEAAHAGLEEAPLFGTGASLPYVVKSPYAYQFIDRLLARDDVQIDGVIIPIRDVIEAASSRSLVEMQNLHRTVPWISELDDTWEQWALTPGGVVYSLNALDQARLLALGFHHLVERLIKANIKIGFIHFPEMITDADYLFRQIQCFLPDTVAIDDARAAHARIADQGNVRVGSELKAMTSEAAVPDILSPPIKYPRLEENDAIALRREHRRMRGEVQKLEADARLKTELENQLTRGEQARAHDAALISAQAEAIQQAAVSHEHIARQLVDAQSAMAELIGTHEQALQQAAGSKHELVRQLAEAQSTIASLVSTHKQALQQAAALNERHAHQLADARSRIDADESGVVRIETDLLQTRHALADLYRSNSWRMTAPFRAISRRLRSAFR